MTKAVLAAITLSALLCACASSEIVWTKKGGRVTTEDVRADAIKFDAVRMAEPTGYRVIIDRISHDIPFYRAYLKNAIWKSAGV